MRTFPLRIGTPDGLLFEGEVHRSCLPELLTMYLRKQKITRISKGGCL